MRVPVFDSTGLLWNDMKPSQARREVERGFARWVTLQQVADDAMDYWCSARGLPTANARWDVVRQLRRDCLNGAADMVVLQTVTAAVSVRGVRRAAAHATYEARLREAVMRANHPSQAERLYAIAGVRPDDRAMADIHKHADVVAVFGRGAM